MTLTFYIARLKDPRGVLCVAEVYWDKGHHGKILARMSREVAPSCLDNPFWTSEVSYGGPEALSTLRERILAKAERDQLTLVREETTKYAPPKSFTQVTKPETN